MRIAGGLSEGLPVGMMLTAQAWLETTLGRAACAFEQSEDWRDARARPGSVPRDRRP